jgi:gamma-glutamylcyclotransferase (GGCT)/AIG2-like uncharacterized protein YtfP
MRTKSNPVGRNGRVPKRNTRLQRTVSAPQYLFVYGTLKRGARSHRELVRNHAVRFISEARMRGDLYKLDGESFPGAVPTSAPNRFVEGHLFALHDPQKTLPGLDGFEGVDEGLFRRDLVDVWARGRRLKAWAYLYARPLTAANLIPTGIYSPR